MLHNVFSKNHLVVGFPHSRNQLLSSEAVCVNGRVVTRSIYVTDDSVHRYDDVDPNSFLLENQLAAGLDLKEVTMDRSSFVAVSDLPLLPVVKSSNSSQNE